ncbi:helix-turn-helix domain-containing protein [Geobacter argillaceus]|uniref:Cytoskeletal protein RodZ n=1 Tax=Geobacter argillaceus TaxID=345631 RepID=A0A562V971_9BACT|nr:helix-turn-helix domain-containing protein [Geobacter argillaceus]TWJ14348.1 cytoskeletal protein RodZ [Geobacter argillaceus]
MTVSESPDLYHANGRVGATLRELRTSRGIALEEVARVTRIGKGYLLAIEEDRLDKLPSGAYSRGFIRQYAQFLGLGEAEIAALLDPPLPESGDNDRSDQGKRPPRRQPGGANTARNWLLPALLLVLIVLIALVTGDRRPGPVVQPTATVDHPIPAVVAPSATQPRQLAVTSARRHQEQPVAPAAGSQPVAGQQPRGESPSEGVVLRLKVVQDSWLTITIDDAMSQQYELKSGDVIEWKGERSFILDVGNGAAFEGDFNGKPIQSLGEAGKPAHLVLRAKAQNAP